MLKEFVARHREGVEISFGEKLPVAEAIRPTGNAEAVSEQQMALTFNFSRALEGLGKRQHEVYVALEVAGRHNERQNLSVPIDGC